MFSLGRKKKKMNTKPDVIQKCLWPACLVGLFIPGALSLHCNLLHLHLREVTWQNLRLLNSMSNSFPVECLRETRAFELPQDIQSHIPPGKRYLKEAFYEMSTQAFNIFRESTTKSTWKKKYLKQIQIRLDWQMHHLEKCFEEEEKGKEDSKQMEEDGMDFSGAMVSQVSSLELRRYFYRMYNFLKDKKYSHCAWEIIRVELRRCFYYFYKLTLLLRKK
ncbi:interferon kappa [Neofelis nebulosa]|uniref:interferon kappa n=1 Tax=Neofelis nebulosa TaxID=61452 RepID=UPI00272D1369|nr:interferon kappa [Neofelis nebulosa]